MEKMEYSIFYNNWENTKAAESSTNRPTNKVINGFYVHTLKINSAPYLEFQNRKIHILSKRFRQKDSQTEGHFEL